MTFGERLIELRKERGFSNRSDFADYIGMPSTTLRNYETNVREPGHIFLKQMSSIFKVSIDYLLGLTENRELPNKKATYSIQEIDMIQKYRTLDSHGKEMVDIVLHKEYERSSVSNSKLHLMPIAAHNDSTDKEQLDLMMEDANDLLQ